MGLMTLSTVKDENILMCAGTTAAVAGGSTGYVGKLCVVGSNSDNYGCRICGEVGGW